LYFAQSNVALLNFGEALVISNAACSFDHGELYVRDFNICLNDVGDGVAAPCELDEGSPMAWVEADGESTLVGVFGRLERTYYGYCSTYHSSIFNRISEYLDWIQKNAHVEIRL